MSLTEELANWYLTHVVREGNTYADNLRKALNNPGADKAIILLTGEEKRSRDNHVGYLWRFPKTFPYRLELLKRMTNDKLWNMSLTGFSCFEDLYNNLRERYKMSYIGQLAIYDIAIHTIYATGNVSLLPKDFVYVHALPVQGFRFLKKHSELNNTKITIKNGKVPFSKLTKYFPGLDAVQLEDLFCYVGKSVRRVNGKGKNKEPDNELDKNIEFAQRRNM